jgi:Tfp pilus assembly protein PilF
MCTPMPRSFPARPALLCAGLVLALCGCNRMSGHINNQTGMVHYQQGNWTAARYDFHRAVIDDPHNPNYLHNLASAIRKQGDFAGAERVYRQSIAVDPSHQPSYHGLASLLTEQGRQPEAMDLLVAWVDTQPYLAAPHIELARLQRDSGDPAGAEQSLRKALELQPGHPIALAQLGQVYQQTGQYDRAVAMYQRSLDSHWAQPEVHSRLAQLAPAVQAQTAQRYAAMQPIYGAASTFAAAPPVYAAPPVHAGRPVRRYSYYSPGASPDPATVNADPAHVPQAVHGLPVVAPH